MLAVLLPMPVVILDPTQVRILRAADCLSNKVFIDVVEYSLRFFPSLPGSVVYGECSRSTTDRKGDGYFAGGRVSVYVRRTLLALPNGGGS